MSQKSYLDPKTDRKTSGELMVRIGMMVLHSLRTVVHILRCFVCSFGRMLWYMLCQAGRFFRMIGVGFRHAVREHNRPAQEMLRDIRNAQRSGTGGVVRQIFRFIGGWLFGEHGLIRTGFNYVMPVISAVFLIGVVSYGMGLDYALAVTVSGEEIGIVSSETVFEDAREEVRQRITSSGEDIELSYNPVYTLRIVSENDKFATAQSIADRLLISSHAELVDGYGVYVGGEFVGAVKDRDKISAAMTQELSEYALELDELVNEVYYTKEITYQEGVYLKASLTNEQDMIDTLTATTTTESRYVVTDTDTPKLIAMTHGMTERELIRLNPMIEERFSPGMLLKVNTYSRCIPIAYTKTLKVTDYIDYGTVRVETSALNLGVEQVISKGMIGERSSEVLVTYIDGAEDSRKILSTAITKNPIPEQIGVGTYKAMPASSRTVLDGSGKYGWPVNGGYISDHFGGERNHKGLDIAASSGTEIYAAEGGTVYRAGWNTGGYGNYVIIDHPDGYRTLYAHASSVVAYEGQEVEKGQLIAYVGSTGDSTGPHCHFEVRINNICQNPADYLRVNAD